MPQPRKIITTGELTCATCGESKPLAQFAKRSDRPLGHASRCRSCSTRYTMATRDKTKHAADRAAHRKARPDLSRSSRKRYVEKNPKVRAADHQRLKEWRKNNPEKADQSSRSYKARHPELGRIYAANRRAKKRLNEGAISPSIFELLFSEQAGRCPYCLGDLLELGAQLDHYIPIDLGGANADWNLQLTCPCCNKKKSNKHPLEYLKQVSTVR